MALLPPPDIGTAYVDDRERPTKDFFNWLKSLYDYTRNITTGVGSGVPGGSVSQVQYNAGAGNFGGYTNTQVTALLDLFSTTTKGAVPAPGSLAGKFLRDDGAWIVPAGGGGGTPGGSNGQVQFNNAGAFGGLTTAQLTALIDLFTASLRGAVPPSGGGTTNFLRADGTWASPPGMGGGSGTFITGSFTLNAGATTTTVSTTCTAVSRIFWSALTFHAANQMATLFLSSIGTNTFTLTHGNNPNVDQTFSYAVLG